MNTPEAPANLMAEKAVLGSVLSGPEAFFSISEVLQPQHFYRPINAKIFEAIRDIYGANQKFSLHRVVASVGDEFDDGKSTISYLTALLRDADDSELNPLDFVEDIVEAWQRRKIGELESWVSKEARKRETIPADLLDQMVDRIDAIKQNSQSVPLKSIGQFAREAFISSKRAQETGESVGFDTGLPTLDSMLGRQQRGDFGVIGAAQGDGKTVIGAQVLRRIALFQPTIFFQLEMAGEDMARRAMAGEANVSVSEIEEGNYDLMALEELKNAADKLDNERLFIDDRPKLNFDQIRDRIWRTHKTMGLGAVVIDHLRLIRTRQKFPNKFDRIEWITGELKALAKETKVNIITLAQRTRTSQRRDDCAPQITDFDGGSSIEQDADWIIGLARRDRWLAQRRPSTDQESREYQKWLEEYREAKGRIEIYILKRRRGEDGAMEKFLFNGRQGRIEEL
jgi:replicative DNA helicase